MTNICKWFNQAYPRGDSSQNPGYRERIKDVQFCMSTQLFVSVSKQRIVIRRVENAKLVETKNGAIKFVDSENHYPLE